MISKARCFLFFFFFLGGERLCSSEQSGHNVGGAVISKARCFFFFFLGGVGTLKEYLYGDCNGVSLLRSNYYLFLGTYIEKCTAPKP